MGKFTLKFCGGKVLTKIRTLFACQPNGYWDQLLRHSNLTLLERFVAICMMAYYFRTENEINIVSIDLFNDYMDHIRVNKANAYGPNMEHVIATILSSDLQSDIRKEFSAKINEGNIVLLAKILADRYFKDALTRDEKLETLCQMIDEEWHEADVTLFGVYFFEDVFPQVDMESVIICADHVEDGITIQIALAGYFQDVISHELLSSNLTDTVGRINAHLFEGPQFSWLPADNPAYIRVMGKN